MAAVPVNEALECTICLDLPASPIHSCSNGHVICGICADKIDKCGICQANFQVSFLAERLSRQLDFTSQCPNYPAGCRNPITSAKLKDHITNCYYRPALCTDRNKEVCKNLSIPFKDFPQHLKDKHKSCQWPNGGGTWSRRLRPPDLQKNGAWATDIILKNAQPFILHNWIHNGAVYFWTTVLADKKEAEKYMYKLTLEKKLDEDRKMECSWTLPVLPYHDYPKFKNPLPEFISMQMPFVYQFCKKVEVDGKTWHDFKISYHIM